MKFEIDIPDESVGVIAEAFYRQNHIEGEEPASEEEALENARQLVINYIQMIVKQYQINQAQVAAMAAIPEGVIEIS